MEDRNYLRIESRLRRLDLGSNGDNRPKYERLRRYVAQEVSAGRFPPGAAFPSEQRMARMLRVARTTVRQALAELERDGFVIRKHGAGTCVSDAFTSRPTSRLAVFALVTPGGNQGFWPSLQLGFESAAAGMNKQILACSTDNSLDRQAHVFLQLIEKRVLGVALAPTSLPVTPAYQVRHLQDSGIPVVLCHRGVPGIEAPLLEIPFREIGREAGRVLLANGHRRIAFYSMHERNEASAGYESGLREVLQGAGTDLVPELTYWGRSNSPYLAAQADTLAAALRGMLAGSNPPTAIFASFDPVAERIYMILREMGLRVPEDVALIGFGGTNRDGALRERLTSIVIDEEEVGRRAARMLDEINEKQRSLFDTGVISIQTGVSAGKTVGPAPRAVPGELARQAGHETEDLFAAGGQAASSGRPFPL